jgi:hypothetical protein
LDDVVVPTRLIGNNDWNQGERVMLRKMIIALLAAAPMAMFAPDAASARGGGGGGHFGGGMGGHFAGGMGGGTHMGGGMHMGGGPHFGGGFHHHRFGGIGLGFYGPYYDGDYYPYDGYPSYVDEGDSGCYLVRRRVHTRYGWRLRRVQICQ